MIGLTRLLFLSTVFLVIFTLVYEVPPFRIYLLDIAFVPLLVSSIFTKLLEPRSMSFRWSSFDSAIVVLFLVISIAFAYSDNVSQSVVEYMDWIRIILIYFITRSLFPQALGARAIMRFFYLAMAVLLLVGVIQFVTGTSFGLIGNYFGENLDQSITVNLEGYRAETRISGTTTNPIVYAMWLTIFSLVVLSDLIASQRYVSFYFVSGITLLVVVSTLSRGAIAACMFSWVLLIFLHKKTFFRTRMFVPALVFSFLLAPAMYLLVERLEVNYTLSLLEARVTQQDLLEEESGRMQALRMGMDLLADPKVFLIGTGPGNFLSSHEAQAEGIVRMIKRGTIYSRTGIHNMWMKTWVECGAFAAALLVIVWIGAVRRALVLLRTKSDEPFTKTIACASLAFLVPFLAIDTQVYESSASYHILIPLFVLTGILVSSTESVTQKVRRSRSSKLHSNQPGQRRPVTGHGADFR